MQFNVNKSIEVLERTPEVLKIQLSGLSDDWTMNNEGGETWSPYDVVGHLLHGENTDWPARLRIILSNNTDKRFTPFDRFAQFENSKGKTLNDLLNDFANKRSENLKELKSMSIKEEMHSLSAIHPVFGEVTLSQLLSTWAVHDLNHLAQINRVMAKQYKEAVGPWIEYMRILKS